MHAKRHSAQSNQVVPPPQTSAGEECEEGTPRLGPHARLQTVLDHAPIVLFSFDERGIISVFEGRGLALAKLEPGEHVGRCVFEVFEAHPWMTECARRALEGETLSTSGEMRGRWLDVRFTPLRSAEGKITGVIGTGIDITERQRAQEELSRQQAVLKYVIGNVPHAIFWKDRQGRFLGGNQHFLNDCSMQELEQLVGKTDFDLWGEDEASFFVKVDREVMNRGVPVLDIEERLVRGDGEPRVLLTSKVPIRDEGGVVTGILGIYADITERKQMELELHKAKEAADAAARAKGDFLTTMSHELRTPLSLILGPLDSLLSDPDEPLSPRMRADLQRIQRSSRRLHRLVDDVLDYQKMEAGKMTVEWEAIDVAELIADMVEEARPAAERRRLELGTQIESALGVVPLDRRKFEKVALNLLGNALKFTPPGGRVTVALRALADVFELAVADTGPGIPPDKMPLLFQRFQQIDTSPTRRFEGTGIGLSLVKELTELMAGTIGVESEPGNGTRFFVRLPRAPDHLVMLDPEHLLTSVSAVGTGTSAGYLAELEPELAPQPRAAVGEGRGATEPVPRLLVVEDNPDMRSYLENICLAENEVTLAANGREALDALKTTRPDVILSDVMMPEMDGFELVRQLKSDPELRDIPIILLTARAGRAAAAGGLEVGADDYLSKPFEPLELKARIRAAKRLHSTYLELAAKNHDLATTLQQLTETHRKLVQSGKMAAIGTLVAGLSHELNNPVGVILMNAQLLLRRQASGHGLPNEAMLLKIMRTIEQQAQRCAELVHALLDYSRGKAVGRSPCDVSAALRRALQLSAPRAHERRVNLEVQLDAEDSGAPLPPVLANPSQLDTALLNVINNALDATPHGGAVVVEAHRLPSKDIQGVEIDVRDTGCGIRREDLERLFEPFFTTKAPGEGTGLGLPLTHRFIEESGGNLRIDSEPGEGTTVHMWLPTIAPEVRQEGGA
jgi:PAS domain S-box-containing protein